MSGTWDAALYLESGHLYRGDGFGAKTSKGGEIVFNTGMSGYQEVFSDLSYSRQIVVMTYPHMGNTGINPEDPESRGLSLSGVVTRDAIHSPSNWRSTDTLSNYLEESRIPAISGVDTREITIVLRSEGAQRAVIFPVENAQGKSLETYGAELLKNVPSMEGLELVSEASCKEPYDYEDVKPEKERGQTLVVYDFGAKSNILRHLRRRGFRVRVVPYNYPAEEVIKEKPAGLFLTNGPGDPALANDSVKQISALLGKFPLMAICMGHQLLARSLGASTYKLKFGHHGINHPVKDLQTGRILITSHNHGFAVDPDSLKGADIEVTHRSLNDGTLEGFRSSEMKFLSVQFHPEACPGPNDAAYLFDEYVRGYLQ